MFVMDGKVYVDSFRERVSQHLGFWDCSHGNLNNFIFKGDEDINKLCHLFGTIRVRGVDSSSSASHPVVPFQGGLVVMFPLNGYDGTKVAIAHCVKGKNIVLYKYDIAYYEEYLDESAVKYCFATEDKIFYGMETAEVGAKFFILDKEFNLTVYKTVSKNFHLFSTFPLISNNSIFGFIVLESFKSHFYSKNKNARISFVVKTNKGFEYLFSFKHPILFQDKKNYHVLSTEIVLLINYDETYAQIPLNLFNKNFPVYFSKPLESVVYFIDLNRLEVVRGKAEVIGSLISPFPANLFDVLRNKEEVEIEHAKNLKLLKRFLEPYSVWELNCVKHS